SPRQARQRARAEAGGAGRRPSLPGEPEEADPAHPGAGVSTFKLPKFSIGDRVYVARTHVEQTVVDCPDCLGGREATVTLASGEAFTIACPGCHRGYLSDGTSRVGKYAPWVQALTVGQVRMEVVDDRSTVSYMARETGVG